MTGPQLSVAFFLQMFAILAVCRLVGTLARRLGQPQVVGEMIAGVLLGPSLFGLCFPDLQKKLFPPDSLKVLYRRRATRRGSLHVSRGRGIQDRRLCQPRAQRGGGERLGHAGAFHVGRRPGPLADPSARALLGERRRSLKPSCSSARPCPSRPFPCSPASFTNEASHRPAKGDHPAGALFDDGADGDSDHAYGLAAV